VKALVQVPAQDQPTQTLQEMVQQTATQPTTMEATTSTSTQVNPSSTSIPPSTPR